jgi:hypothetical protein
VSEYLTRLVTRARESDARQLLRPSVRSSSPIAAHDQRIGMTVAESFKSVGAPPDSIRSESATGSLGEFETAGRPGVEPGSGTGETTIQRNVTASAVGQAGTAPHTAAVGPAAGETLPSPGSTEAKTPLPELAVRSGADVRGAADENEFNEPLAPWDITRIEPSSNFPKMRAGGDEPPGSAAGSTRPDTWSSGSLAIHDTIREASQVNVHTRSVRPESEIDSPRLEPKMPVFIDGVEPSAGDSAASPAAVDHGPRVVIGRIDVEVVPPAVQQGTSAPRSGPLTAASVSVIGPLGGIRPNMRLSLRYR